MIHIFSFIKSLLFIFIFQIIFIPKTQAQELNTSNNKKQFLSGNVIDSETLKPIPHVEVFISGSTSGCITDSLGNFNLKIPFFPCTLVADHVAYESFITPLEKQKEKFKMALSPSLFSINEISVSGKNKRKRNLRFFYSRFIKENKNKLNILNDSVLIFDRTKMDFKASTKEPLIISNNYLGYNIKAIIEKFHVYCVDEPNGSKISLNSTKGGDIIQLSGYYYYEPIKTSSHEKMDLFEKNRRLNYYGSYRHFLKSIYDENPGQQGYEMEFFLNDTDLSTIKLFEKGIKSSESDQVKNCLFTGDSIKITYIFDDNKFPINIENLSHQNYFDTKKSIIYPSKESFQIRPNGTSPNVNFIIQGAMSPENFTNSLPEDYEPSKNSTLTF
jgi:hypothetical protein